MRARFGPSFADTGAFATATEGSSFIQDLSIRFATLPAVEGRVPLMPFQGILWGDRTGTVEHLESMRVKVFVPGLTNLDLVIDQTATSRLLFRLSRHPNVPGGFILQRWGVSQAQAPVDGWDVPETIISPERRSQLMQINYHWPHRSFAMVAEEFQGEWFDVRIQRQGDRFRAHVNGESIAEIVALGLPHGGWGLQGGDLPLSYLQRVELRGETLSGGQWQRGSLVLDFRNPDSVPAMIALASVRWSGAAAAAAMLLATLGWLVAPAIPWGHWLRRSLLCSAAVAFLSARWALFDLIEFPANLDTAFQICVWTVCVLGALLIASAGPHWRFGFAPLKASGLGGALAENWRALRMTGRLLWMACVGVLIVFVSAHLTGALRADPLPRALQTQVLKGRPKRPLVPGDYLYTDIGIRHRGRMDFTDGSIHLVMEAMGPRTEVEILAHILDVGIASIPDWTSLRLSTEAGASGFLDGDSLDPMQAIDFTLPIGRPVDVLLSCERGEFIAIIDEVEVARFPSTREWFGGFGFVVRSGSVDISTATAAGRVDFPGGGDRTPLRSWPPMRWMQLGGLVALAAGVAFAFPLASWLGLGVGRVLIYLILVALVIWYIWVSLALNWVEHQPHEFWNRPIFPFLCAVLMALGGVYFLVVSQWDVSRRRGLATLGLIVLAIVTTESAIRATGQRYHYSADLQGGYIRDQYLLRWLQGPLLHQTLRGQPLPRGEDARPREAGDDVLRLICLGGSSTYGSGVALPENAWPHRLEMRLQSAGVSAEVFNFGYPSLTAFDDLLYLRRDLLPLDPDWVILCAGGNDAIRPVGNPAPQRAQWEALQSMSPLQRRLRRFLLRTRALVFLNQWIHSIVTPLDSARRVEQHPPDDFRLTLEELCDLGEEQGFRVALVEEPMWESVVFDVSAQAPWHDAMESVAEERGALLIDPVPQLREHLADDIWATWIHPTVWGNRLMAEAVLEPLLQAIEATPEATDSSGLADD